jgi:hypothetical protein
LLMGVPQASHCSSLAGPPQNRGMLSYGSRPSLSFSRIRRRIAGTSTILCVDQVGHPCLVKIDHMVRVGFRRDAHARVGKVGRPDAAEIRTWGGARARQREAAG